MICNYTDTACWSQIKEHVHVIKIAGSLAPKPLKPHYYHQSTCVIFELHRLQEAVDSMEDWRYPQAHVSIRGVQPI